MSNQSMTPGWQRRAGLDSPQDDRPGPSLPAMLVGGAALVIGALLVVGVVVPAVFTLLALALPIVLLVVGVRLLSKGNGTSPLTRLGGWAAAILGGVWLLDVLDVLNIGRIVLAGLLVAGAAYVGRNLVRRR